MEAVTVGTGVTNAQALAVLSRAGKFKKRSLWPVVVRDRRKGVSIQNRRLTGAHNFPVEIRSRSGNGYFAMGHGLVGARVRRGMKRSAPQSYQSTPR